MTLLIFTLAFLFAVIVIRDILMRATIILHQAIIRHALTTNFARFSETEGKTSRVVIVDRSRGYFLKNNVLWVCEVEDGEPDPTTAKPIDMFSLPSDDLDEVQAVVDALNAGENLD